MKKVNIGLDIGIASVGWAVLDEKFQILKHGVRLFEKMEHPTTNKLKNEERRESRSLRRQKNRSITRKNDFIKWLNEIGWINITIDKNERNHKYRYEFVKKYIENNESPFNLRLKGLNQKLSKKELIIILYFYLNLRGFKYTIANDEETKKLREKYKNIYDSKEKFPIKIQNLFYKKYRYYRSEINRNFHSLAYKEEISHILEKSKIEDKIKDQFIKNFLNRQRDYEEGPLSKTAAKKMKDKSKISSYSRFSYDPKTKKLLIRKNMWEGKEGKCTYCKNQPRINKHSFSAQIFNLLNDLNNISINKKNKLTLEDKKEIIDLSIKSKKNINSALKHLSKKYDIDEGEIERLRINKSNKKLLTQLDSYHIVKKVNNSLINIKNLLSNNFVNEEVNKINKIIQILSQTILIEKRKEYFEKELNSLDDETIKKLSEEKSSFSKNHSLSKKAIDIMLPDLLNENLNQMEIAHKLGLKTNEDIAFSNNKYIPLNWIDDENFIASPTTKRAIRQSLKVLNRIIKSHDNWKIENIVIEMARDLNGKQAKESKKNNQKYWENYNKDINEEIKDFEKKKGYKMSLGTKRKLRLWKQQKGFDAYTGEKLVKNKVIEDPKYTSVDHIIPYSFCFDDSENNKVLTLSSINSKKGNNQPFKYLGDSKLSFLYEKYWKNWYSNDKMKEKLENLINKIDYSDPANSFGFIGRNLVDTRHASKKVLSILKIFIKKQINGNVLYKTKIKTIKGKFTNFFRKKIDTKKEKLERPNGLEDGSFDEKTGKKERIWNGHHAEDAVIVVHAALKNKQLDRLIEKFSSKQYITKEEISNFAKEKKLVINENEKNKIIDFKFIRDSLNKNKDDVYFSYMINKKTNLKLFNDTTYSGKYMKLKNDKEEKFYKIEKIILEDLIGNKEKFKKAFDKLKNSEIFIPMRKYDKKTFEIVLKAFENSDPEKPFLKKLDTKNRLFIQNDKNKRYISKIKYIKEEKNESEIIFIKNPNNKKSSKSFKESMNWFAINIYKDNKDKNHLIPLNALNCKIIKKGNHFKYEYNDEYYKQLKKNNLNKKLENTTIYYGSIIEDLNGNLYKVIGVSAKKYYLELKPLHKLIKKRELLTINTKIKNWKLIEINEIGEKINKKFIF